MQEVLDKHYRRLAKDYDEFLHYSNDFVRKLTSKMVEKLELTPADALADIGCGTGIYSRDILEQVPFEQPVLGVDPFGEMLDKIPPTVPITPIVEDALEFSRKPGEYNKVLIKETIHHINDIETLLQNLYNNLPSGGILLMVHVPPNVQYPLFDKALARCLEWHADPIELVRLSELAGFSVDRDGHDHQHRIPKEHYHRMVANCYMSALTSLNEEELAAGLEEMEQKHADLEILEFTDHFDFITAKKT